MRANFVRLFYVCLLSVLGAQTILPQRLINVFVDAGADGFTSAGGGDSAKDLAKSLQGKNKTLRVVDAASEADVVVYVRSREERKKLGSIITNVNKSDDGKHSTTTTRPTEETTYIVHAVIKAGDFQTDLDGEGMTWRWAADRIAGRVDSWVKQNSSRLLEKRTDRSGFAQPQPVASSAEAAQVRTETKEASIRPGMTSQEVTDAMGDPLKKVNFGERSLWEYKGIQVVFEKDKVVDVKF